MNAENSNNMPICRFCENSNRLTNIVISRGNPKARLMFIGEAPGALEDQLGKPFVGRSGQLLDKLTEDVGINLSKDAYICNVVKCRPPNNRKPTKSEVIESMPWLLQQITLIDPFVICLLGSTALEVVLGKKGGLSNIRGHWYDWDGRLVMPLFHPAYLLRNPSKEEGKPLAITINDLLAVRDKLTSLQKTLL